MGEVRDVEAAVQFAIDARENIEIERRSDADGIVVSGEQFGPRLDEVRTEEKVVARLHAAAHTAAGIPAASLRLKFPMVLPRNSKSARWPGRRPRMTTSIPSR